MLIFLQVKRQELRQEHATKFKKKSAVESVVVVLDDIDRPKCEVYMFNVCTIVTAWSDS